MVVQDAVVIREELDLIALLSGFSAMDIDMTNSLLNRMKMLLNDGLNSSRPSISLDMLQRVIWRIESRSKDDLLSSHVIENSCSTWFMFVFQNVFTEFSTISDAQESVFNGHRHERISKVSLMNV
jgi:hypothetical protein